MTKEGREELAAFETAPLLMDGRKDRASGACGADRVNMERLYQVAAASGKPIAALRAYHDKKEKKQKSRPDQMASEDLFKTACKQVKNVRGAKKVKNHSEDVFGNKMGAIHIPGRK